MLFACGLSVLYPNHPVCTCISSFIRSPCCLHMSYLFYTRTTLFAIFCLRFYTESTQFAHVFHMFDTKSTLIAHVFRVWNACQAVCTCVYMFYTESRLFAHVLHVLDVLHAYQTVCIYFIHVPDCLHCCLLVLYRVQTVCMSVYIFDTRTRLFAFVLKVSDRGQSVCTCFLSVLYPYQAVCTCFQKLYMGSNLFARVFMCLIRVPGCLHVFVQSLIRSFIRSPSCLHMF